MHSVCDEDAAVWVGAPCDFDCSRVQMQTVDNQAEEGAEVGAGAGGRGGAVGAAGWGCGARGGHFCAAEDAEDAWIAVVEGAHGVEEVGDHSCARSDGGAGLLVGGF